jgi:hypothetical protein
MEVSGQIQAPTALPPGTHWIGGWVGPRVGLDAVEKRKILRCRESNPGYPALQRPSLTIVYIRSVQLFLILKLVMSISKQPKIIKLCDRRKYVNML